MQTVQFLHAAFAEALPTIHARRLAVLMAAVAALLQGRRLTLTALGRSMPGSAWPRERSSGSTDSRQFPLKEAVCRVLGDTFGLLLAAVAQKTSLAG